MPRTLWTRDFALYFAARSVSLLGDTMMPVAAAVGVGRAYGITGVGLVMAAWSVPFVVLILFGGVFADRLGARPMMVAADAVRVLTQATVAVLFAVGTPPMWLLLACSALAGGAAAMFQPGVSSMVPRVAVDVQRANATLKVASALAQLAGPAVAGTAIALAGAGTVYAIDAGTFAVSCTCLLALRLPARSTLTAPAEPTTVWRDMYRGWREFRSRTWMWSVILVWAAFGLLVFGPSIPVGSALIGGRLGPAAYGWTEAALGAGTVLGGLVALRIRPARPLRAGAVAMFGFSASSASIALHASLTALLVAHLVTGAAWAFWSVMWATSVQTHVAAEVLNRVTAYEVAGSNVSLAVGQAIAGPLAGTLTPTRTMAVSAAVCVAGCAALLAIPAVRGQRAVTAATAPAVPAPVG